MDATILIVDDSPFIVDGLAAILSRKEIHTCLVPMAVMNVSKSSRP